VASPRYPDFFIVGHPKSGTTALYLMLREHPEIFMPMKETRFFAPEWRMRLNRLGPDRAPRTLEQYLALFDAAGPEQLLGEATPEYLMSREAAEKIAQARPDAKIIVVLREPVSFLRSFHLQSLHNYVETEKDFRKAILLEQDRRRGRRVPRFSQSPEMLMYSELVRYTEQVRRYHAVFPPEQVMVLVYEDFRGDNDATVRSVMRFLGVDDTQPIERRKTNTAPAVRFLALKQLERVFYAARNNPNAKSPLLRAVNTLVPRRLNSETFARLWRRTVYTTPKPPDQAFTRELRRRFKPEVEALSDYLGRDLVSLWGYEDVE
jgi:hypothetical protein